MAMSAQVFWDLEGVADGPPDDFGVYAVRESALGGAPAEFVEDEILGHALRVRVAELRPHPVPEFRQPHAARVLPGPGWVGAGVMTRVETPQKPFNGCVVIKYRGSSRAWRTS